MMSLKELKKYLTHRVPFPDREFDALMKKGKELRFKARMPIIKTGDVDENVYIVRYFRPNSEAASTTLRTETTPS